MATLTMPKLHKTRIDIPEENRVKLIQMLNQSLATIFDLHSQVKQAHWNVKGKDFFQLHELFDELAGELAEYVDDLAERATTLGGDARGTARMAAEHSTLPEYPQVTDGMKHIEALAERYAAAGKELRQHIEDAEKQNDADTADLFTEISRSVDMRLWFLEAHLQG